MLACLVPRPAAAQDAKAQLAELKQAESAALGVAKSAIRSARQIALLAIKAIEATVKAGAFTNGAFTQLTASLDTYQRSVSNAVDVAASAQQTTAHDTLGALPGPLNGHYPRGFAPGDGGLSDAFRVKIEALLAGSTRWRPMTDRLRARPPRWTCAVAWYRGLPSARRRSWVVGGGRIPASTSSATWGRASSWRAPAMP